MYNVKTYNVKMVAKFNSNETARRFASHVYPFGVVPKTVSCIIDDNVVSIKATPGDEWDANDFANTVRFHTFGTFSSEELISFETTIEPVPKTD